jgi:hypothetical protein
LKIYIAKDTTWRILGIHSQLKQATMTAVMKTAVMVSDNDSDSDDDVE